MDITVLKNWKRFFIFDKRKKKIFLKRQSDNLDKLGIASAFAAIFNNDHMLLAFIVAFVCLFLAFIFSQMEDEI